MIGLLTPPVGMVLYVLSRVSGISFEKCMRGTFPFLIPLVIALLRRAGADEGIPLDSANQTAYAALAEATGIAPLKRLE
ncbi:TRAP transporter large permease subunit [Halomonas kalidii]|uniref:TRAP transporter large permease subunit n=1 Tax=Halomonas kalidii TaxID=3043293 RepID=A0ABT6VN46_9GAMM|nr:TRAP transporter large permease subunit [Halomonas kalidii]MDI5934398.1 TRAP transporter large permease subunit [Halomonas kalidii]